MSKVFAVTSGKGGVGKSTVSVGLALSLCKMGKKVLLIDMDEGLRCLDLMLGIDKTAVFDLSDILMGKEIADAVYPVEQIKGLHLIPAPAKLGMIDAYAFTKFVGEVVTKYDIVIFDFPAGIDFSLYNCLPKGALFLTVAAPDPVTVRDAATVSRMLAEIDCNSRLIINRFEYKLSRKQIFKNIDEIIDSAGLQLIGIIPKSEALALFSVKHNLKPNDNATAAFERISNRLLGNSVPLPKPRKI